MVPKPEKNLEDASFYRLISLLSILSKIFQKIYIKRLTLMIDQKQLIPEHQFRFEEKHETVEQVARLLIREDLNLCYFATF